MCRTLFVLARTLRNTTVREESEKCECFSDFLHGQSYFPVFSLGRANSAERALIISYLIIDWQRSSGLVWRDMLILGDIIAIIVEVVLPEIGTSLNHSCDEKWTLECDTLIDMYYSIIN